jgi:tRNA(Ile)-lysidine synthase
MRQNQKKLPVEQRVEAFFKEQDIAGSEKPLLVAVSGGPDSVCLFHVLNRLKKELGLKLQVIHLDHGLRGRASAADAQYVLDLCHRLKVPVVIEQRDVKAYRSEHKLSLEEAAREVRYNFFAEFAESIGAEKIAIGHTLDDQVETVLFNLIRGTGTRGLRGLQPIHYLNSAGSRLAVIRPLLKVSRQETAMYCRRHRLNPREDVTNRSLTLTRNRIRLQLLPILKTYNPDITEALLRTARTAGDDIAYLETMAARYSKKIIDKQNDVIILKKQPLLKIPVSLKRLVLRQAIEGLLGTLKDIEARHIEEMFELLNKPAGKRINLPYGLYFVSEYNRFLLGRELNSFSPLPPLEKETRLSVPGLTEIDGWKIDISITPPKKVLNEKFTAYLDAGLIRNDLTVRRRRVGDRFQPLGMGVEKKVGQFMIDARIPRLWRDRVPVVCSGNQVVWLAGYRIDERFKVNEETKRVLKIRFERF